MINQLALLIWMTGLLVITCVVFNSRFFSFLDNNIESRVAHIDGLRFFLSIFVAFHHYILSYEYFSGRPWSLESISNYPINTKSGPIGVTIFFMVSGYVFASANVRSWPDFYKKRFLRIAPMFTLSSLCCIAIALWTQKDNIYTGNMLTNLYFWLDAGFTGSKPDLFGMPNTQLINAGVSWTLYYEWAFYFSLPLAYIFRDKIGIIPLSISVFFISTYLVSNYSQSNAAYIAYFALGFLSRELPNHIKISKQICNATITILLIMMFIFIHDVYSIYYIPVIAALFIFISLGGDFFGLLNKKGFRRLGDASYSIYLLHGIAWFCMNKTIHTVGIIVSPFQYMLISSVVFFALLLISITTYMFIEKPFIALGMRKKTN